MTKCRTLRDHMKTLNQPGHKHPVERIMEDFVRSAHSDLSNDEQSEIYNDLMIDLFETIRERSVKGLQPVRISKGNKVWKNYRDIYVDDCDGFEKTCKEAFDLYTGRIPGNYGRG